MPNPGDLVILMSVPPSLYNGLPEDERSAIRNVGKPVTFAGLSYGQAEIEFTDNRGDDHTIWVDVSRIRPA
jgi:hypothetical protein